MKNKKNIILLSIIIIIIVVISVITFIFLNKKNDNTNNTSTSKDKFATYYPKVSNVLKEDNIFLKYSLGSSVPMEPVYIKCCPRRRKLRAGESRYQKKYHWCHAHV